MHALWTAPSRALVADSVTTLGADARDRIVVSGSHAGRYACALAATAGVRGIVLNDAGIGLRRAGVAGLELLQDAGIPGAAVAHRSAAIGDAEATLAHGVISVVNEAARALGCRPGMRAARAARRMERADAPGELLLPQGRESRHLLVAGQPAVWALDSAALVRPGDAGSVLMLGSHGALVGGDAAMALRTDALAAVFNDAGDPASAGRLPVLNRRGVAAAVVAANSAAIGDGRSTYHEGVLSAVNARAAVLGATPGMSAKHFATLACDHGGTPLGHQP